MNVDNRIEKIDDMYKGNYQFAGIPVSITSVCREIHRMCVDYQTDQEPLFSVITSKEEIFEEIKRNEVEDMTNIKKSYIETLLVYRKIATDFMNRGILLIHGSVIAVDGEGYLFTALSGTGKSTHTRLWRNMLGDRAVMVNDDKPLVKVGTDVKRSIVYGTPWDGKHHISNNIAVPLKAIIYLERGLENEIHEVTPKEMLRVLLQQTFRENDMETTVKVLDLLSELAKSVKFYDLHCNMEPEAAEVAYKGMN